MVNEAKPTINFQLYELDRQSKENKNLFKHVNQAIDFYNGKQFADVNKGNMIRVVQNICMHAVKTVGSKVVGTPLYFTFTSDNYEVDCTALRQFDEYNCKKLKLETANYHAVITAYVTGTAISYIVWDEDDTTYKGIYKGGLREELIDIRRFAVADPSMHSIQNQAWVMFWSDVPVGAAKEMLECKKGEREEKEKLIERSIKSAVEGKDLNTINHSLIPVYTRFFRIGGEVYFMCSTEYVDLFEYPHPISKKVASNKIKKIIEEYKRQKANDEPNENGDLIDDYKIDYEDFVMQAVKDKSFSNEQYSEEKEKFSLYPFAVFRADAQTDLFYGRSLVTSLIPTQKGINMAYSFTLKCVQNNAYNKIFVKPDALRGQKITNEPGQVLVDYTPFANGWGIKMAESQPMPNNLIDIAERMYSMSSKVNGFSAVMDGTVSNGDTSGYMVDLMIKQANTSIEQQQRLFWDYNEDKAAIRLMFYKHYVDEAKYTYELTEEEYEQNENARKTIYGALLSGKRLDSIPEDAKPEDFAKPSHKVKTNTVRGKDLWGNNFDICVEVKQGLTDSKLVQQQTWENLLMNGGLQNIPPENLELFLAAAPNSQPEVRVSLKRVIEKQKQGKIAQLEHQIAQMVQQNQQLVSYCKQLESANGYQGEYLKNLQTEFSNKINTQNKIIQGMSKEMDKTNLQDRKTMGEVKSNNSRGIEGSSTQQ